MHFWTGLGEERPFVKIGMELFYAEGPAIVREIKRRGHKIFLDLKLHDIPNTVKRAMAILSGLNVDIINLHAAGTIEMMRAALEGLTRPDGSRPLLIAVTQLTSTSEQRMREELLIDHPINEVIVHYAENAKAAGLDGVVCSPLEAGMVKEACGKDFLTVTPGVRFAGGSAGDQVRITTRHGRGNWDRIILWSAGRSLRQRIRWQRTGAVSRNLAAETRESFQIALKSLCLSEIKEWNNPHLPMW